MKWIKIFENFDEDLEYLKDILVDVKDIGCWNYSIHNDSLQLFFDKRKIYIDSSFDAPLWGNRDVVFNRNILEEKAKYKIFFDSGAGDVFDEQMMKIIKTCISYMSGYNYFITLATEDEDTETLIDLEYLNSRMDIKFRYYLDEYIILRFTEPNI